MRIVVGLGNPGRAYAHTRHNVGFCVVDELARRWDIRLGRPHRGLRMTRGVICGQPTTLVEPQMYMNVSGDALAQLDGSIAAPALIVIHDDLDLATGRLRVKRGGGTAGHHGLDSIVARYGADFTRVRIGIGRAPHGTDPAEHVLSNFEGDEGELIAAAIQRAADAVECIVRDGDVHAMNCFNVRPHGERTAGVTPIGRE